MQTVLFHVSKVLQEFVYPFNVAMLLLVGAWWFHRRNRHRLGNRLLGAGLLLIFVAGSPGTGYWLVRGLERAYPAMKIDDYPAADAIVVLGGTTADTVYPRLEAEEPNGCRLLPAARLLAAGKAPFVLVAGGGSYKLPDGTTRVEADDMRDILLRFGRAAERIVWEGASRTTYENAINADPLLKERHVRRLLLVTSAFHMPRAAAYFKKLGYEVETVPTGYEMTYHPTARSLIRPTPDALARTTQGVKEYVGLLAYRLLGKL